MDERKLERIVREAVRKILGADDVLLQELEQKYVESNGVAGTLDIVAEICTLKADFADENWGSPLNHEGRISSQWRIAGEMVEEASREIESKVGNIGAPTWDSKISMPEPGTYTPASEER